MDDTRHCCMEACVVVQGHLVVDVIVPVISVSIAGVWTPHDTAVEDMGVRSRGV
jgi:hypothetical protein